MAMPGVAVGEKGITKPQVLWGISGNRLAVPPSNLALKPARSIGQCMEKKPLSVVHGSTELRTHHGGHGDFTKSLKT